MISEILEKIRLITQTLGEEDPELGEIINTETNVNKLLDYFVFKYSLECDFQESIVLHLGTLNDRLKSSLKREDKLKEIIQTFMEALPDKTKRLPAGTVTLKNIAPKIVVDDEKLLPKECFETVKKLVKKNVYEEFEKNGSLPGCHKTNGSVTISIRRK